MALMSRYFFCIQLFIAATFVISSCNNYIFQITDNIDKIYFNGYLQIDPTTQLVTAVYSGSDFANNLLAFTNTDPTTTWYCNFNNSLAAGQFTFTKTPQSNKDHYYFNQLFYTTGSSFFDSHGLLIYGSKGSSFSNNVINIYYDSGSGGGGYVNNPSTIGYYLGYSGNFGQSVNVAVNITSTTLCITAPPSASPIVSPTSEPSSPPTSVPTTSVPSLQPSAIPSLVPSVLPTFTPTLTPTAVPTIFPTFGPTAAQVNGYINVNQTLQVASASSCSEFINGDTTTSKLRIYIFGLSSVLGVPYSSIVLTSLTCEETVTTNSRVALLAVNSGVTLVLNYVINLAYANPVTVTTVGNRVTTLLQNKTVQDNTIAQVLTVINNIAKNQTLTAALTVATGITNSTTAFIASTVPLISGTIAIGKSVVLTFSPSMAPSFVPTLTPTVVPTASPSVAISSAYFFFIIKVENVLTSCPIQLSLFNQLVKDFQSSLNALLGLGTSAVVNVETPLSAVQCIAGARRRQLLASDATLQATIYFNASVTLFYANPILAAQQQAYVQALLNNSATYASLTAAINQDPTFANIILSLKSKSIAVAASPPSFAPSLAPVVTGSTGKTSRDELSGGEIAAIVIFTIIGFFCILFLIAYIFYRVQKEQEQVETIEKVTLASRMTMVGAGITQRLPFMTRVPSVLAEDAFLYKPNNNQLIKVKVDPNALEGGEQAVEQYSNYPAIGETIPTHRATDPVRRMLAEQGRRTQSRVSGNFMERSSIDESSGAANVTSIRQQQSPQQEQPPARRPSEPLPPLDDPNAHWVFAVETLPALEETYKGDSATDNAVAEVSTTAPVREILADYSRQSDSNRDDSKKKAAARPAISVATLPTESASNLFAPSTELETELTPSENLAKLRREYAALAAKSPASPRSQASARSQASGAASPRSDASSPRKDS